MNNKGKIAVSLIGLMGVFFWNTLSSQVKKELNTKAKSVLFEKAKREGPKNENQDPAN